MKIETITCSFQISAHSNKQDTLANNKLNINMGKKIEGSLPFNQTYLKITETHTIHVNLLHYLTNQ